MQTQSHVKPPDHSGKVAPSMQSTLEFMSFFILAKGILEGIYTFPPFPVKISCSLSRDHFTCLYRSEEVKTGGRTASRRRYGVRTLG
jgi:hypothetical protein